MGLQMTLPKESNPHYFDYINAYWAIDNVTYTTDEVGFSLVAYPTRDAKLANTSVLPTPSINGFGESELPYVDSVLYRWSVFVPVSEIFLAGVIPAGRDTQYTAIYNWIKTYTQLPFEDVFE